MTSTWWMPWESNIGCQIYSFIFGQPQTLICVSIYHFRCTKLMTTHSLWNTRPMKQTVSADQNKHQSSTSLACVREIHRWPVNFPHKGSVTRKMFSFDGVIMRYKKKSRSERIEEMAWCRSVMLTGSLRPGIDNHAHGIHWTKAIQHILLDMISEGFFMYCHVHVTQYKVQDVVLSATGKCGYVWWVTIRSENSAINHSTAVLTNAPSSNELERLITCKGTVI